MVVLPRLLDFADQTVRPGLLHVCERIEWRQRLDATVVDDALELECGMARVSDARGTPCLGETQSDGREPSVPSSDGDSTGIRIAFSRFPGSMFSQARATACKRGLPRGPAAATNARTSDRLSASAAATIIRSASKDCPAADPEIAESVAIARRRSPTAASYSASSARCRSRASIFGKRQPTDRRSQRSRLSQAALKSCDVGVQLASFRAKRFAEGFDSIVFDGHRLPVVADECDLKQRLVPVGKVDPTMACLVTRAASLNAFKDIARRLGSRAPVFRGSSLTASRAYAAACSNLP